MIDLRSQGNGSNDLECDDPQAVKLMIDFFYYTTYDVSTAPSSVVGSDEVDHLERPVSEASRASDTTEHGNEPTISEKHTDAPAQNHLSTHAKVYALASKYDVPKLRSMASKNFQIACGSYWELGNIIDAMNIVFKTTAPNDLTLRKILRQTLAEKSVDLVHENSFREAVESIDGLSFDLFQDLTHTLPLRRRCKVCQKINISECARDGCSHFGFDQQCCDINGDCVTCRTAVVGTGLFGASRRKA